MKKPIKNIFILLQLLHFPLLSQSQKQKDFISTVNKFISICLKKDTAALNRLIDKKTGVYVLWRPGAYDDFVQMKELQINPIGYANTVPPYSKHPGKIKYDELPSFSCAKEQWSKTGCFTDSTARPQNLSASAEWQRKFNHRYSEQIVSKLRQLESISQSVAIITSPAEGIIVSFSYMNNRWWLSIVDKVTGDCSA